MKISICNSTTVSMAESITSKGKEFIVANISTWFQPDELHATANGPPNILLLGENSAAKFTNNYSTSSSSISEDGMNRGCLFEANGSNSHRQLIRLSEDAGTDTWRVSLTLGILLCFAYALVFITGIIGNSFVVAVILRLPRMRTPTNFFIVNLAVADLLVVIFCIPFNLISSLFSAWILGEWICKIVPYLQGVSVSASIDTLIAIAMERYLAICHPMKCQISSRNCRLIILIIWTFSFSITLPWAIFFQQASQNDMLVCTEKWPDEELGNIYFVVAHLLLCYILPLVMITICYALILRRVSMRKIPQETKNMSTELLIQRSKMKVIKMLLVVVILFALSWLPLYVIFTRVKFGPRPTEWEDELIRTITPMAQWLGSSNSCINPILYAFFNKKYRSGFKAVLTSRACCTTLRVEVSKGDTSSRSSNRINLSTQLPSTKQSKGSHRTNNSSGHATVNSQSSSVSIEMPPRMMR